MRPEDLSLESNFIFWNTKVRRGRRDNSPQFVGSNF